MTSSEIRNSFLNFFKDRSHTIVPSAPVIPYDDPTLLFANAGMNQFKDVFLGIGKRSYSRAVDTQKCIRVSGKHNDLEEVGRDTYHHTFFEMLGNWSFGDPSDPDGIGQAGYYKKEAIAWAWELLTKVWGLQKQRLWATVYKDDNEAEQFWKTVTDIDPTHVLHFDEKDNFWEMGETGPCGPCSEIHIDRTPDGTATASMVNVGLADVIEIWNLVFIQYNRDESGKLTSLPSKHVDTGMGFERICAVLQDKNSNYDTDVFTSIIEAVENISDKKYCRTSPSDPRSVKTDIDTAIRVVADHARMLSFAIADGAIPSNTGRGSALKQVLNRAARFGRMLNMHGPFIYKIVDAVVSTMGETYPELIQKQAHIKRIIQTEEERFSETEMNGLEYFYRNIVGEPIRQALIKNGTFDKSWWVDDFKSGENTIIFLSPTPYFPKEIKINIREELKRLNITSISGDDAFKLHDTFGVHIDTTERLAREIGIAVDRAKYETLMEEQKERSRESRVAFDETVNINDSIVTVVNRGRESARKLNIPSFENKFYFVGYESLEAETHILMAQENLVILEMTPFYGESGGQVGDTGKIQISDNTFHVIDTQKNSNVHVHILQEPISFSSGKVIAKVDIPRRLSIMRNHSATHLLHNALRRILGTHVQQAGSLVAPDYLRFDFSHFSKVSEKERDDIETLVNEKIRENIPRTPNLNNIPFDEAKKMGALMFFGEKYGERVNVVQFGDFSTEFCGGTHVNNTGEIGYFKINSESSIASGVRRIEAVTHSYVLELLKQKEISLLEEIEQGISQYKDLQKLIVDNLPLNLEKSKTLIQNLNNLAQQLKEVKPILKFPEKPTPELATLFSVQESSKQKVVFILSHLSDFRKELEKELSNSRIKSLSSSLDKLVNEASTLNGLRIVASKINASCLDELKSLGDLLRSKLGSGIGLLAATFDEKVQLVCVVTDDLVSSKRIEAGKVVGAVAKLLGGGGGGRPHMATAGGKDIAKVDEAIAQTKQIIESLLKK